MITRPAGDSLPFQTGFDAWLDALPLPDRRTPLTVPSPVPGRLDAILTFGTADEWRGHVRRLTLDPRVPTVVVLKYERALKLLTLAWIDGDLIKAAELVAMTALELALKERHVARGLGKPPAFGQLLRALVDRDGLADDDLPLIRRCGGSVVGRLTDIAHPSLREIRNNLAHGDPFDGLPHSGLIELVRDLIAYAYREYLTAGGDMTAD